MPGLERRIDEEHSHASKLSDAVAGTCCTRLFRNKWCANTTIAFFLILNTVLCVLAFVYTSDIVEIMTPFFSWLQSHAYTGYFIFFLIDTLSVPLLLPNVIIILIGGFVFKEAFSFIVSIIFTTIIANLGGLVGCGMSFELGRHCCQKCIRRMCINKFKLAKALDRALMLHGIKLIAMLRLSPFSPFTALNYALGTTSCSFYDFMIGSIAMVVNTFIFVFIGCGLKDISQIVNGTYQGSILYEILLIVGIVISTVMMIVLVFITRN